MSKASHTAMTILRWLVLITLVVPVVMIVLFSIGKDDESPWFAGT